MINFKDKDQLAAIFKYGFLLLLLGLAIPPLYTLAMKMFGIVVAIVGTILVGGGAAYFLPAFSALAANKALALRKWIARENPVETAENELIFQQKQLDDYVEDTKGRMAAGNCMIADAKEMMTKDPAAAAEYEEDIINFHNEMAFREKTIDNMVKSLAVTRQTVDRIRSRWNYAVKHSKFRNRKQADIELNRIIMNEALGEVMRVTQRNSAEMTVDNILARAKQSVADGKLAPVEVPTKTLDYKPYTMTLPVVDVNTKEVVTQ